MRSPRPIDHRNLPAAGQRPARGAASNPASRFDRLHCEPVPEAEEGPDPDPRTEFLRDPSRSAVATNTSPDVGFDVSVNPYRGCEHGCTYCYARPSHELLGLSAGLDFETKILVKPDAPALLRRKLLSPGWKPQVLALSGVTDPYQPVERRLRITRGVLEVLHEFRNPVALITKNALVTRDAGLLGEMASYRGAAASISLTTLDARLQRSMEPRASPPKQRLRAMRALADAGVPVGVMVGPVIPGLTDHEIPALLEAAARAGATRAGCVTLRLPHGVKALFEEWLDANYPERKDKVLNRMRALHGGRLYDGRWGRRQRGRGAFADQIRQLFDRAARRAGFRDEERPQLSTADFRRPGAAQLRLFD